MERIAILGASRGLGQALANLLQKEEVALFLSSRKIQTVEAFQNSNHELIQADFTRPEQQDQLLHEIKAFNPHRLFYVAGGGPFGLYPAREWKDHLWAFQVNFLFPALLLHDLLSHLNELRLKQAVFIGSAIAESQPDPMAASYAAGKHALKGLIDSLKLENPGFDLRLFSPGYMDTQMLPANAWPRHQPDPEKPVRQPEEIAKQLWQWSHSPLS